MTKIEFWANVALILLGTVVFFSVLHFAQNLFAPIILALVVGVVLSPVTDKLDKLGLPKGMTALSSLMIILFLIVTLAFLLEPAVDRAVRSLPKITTEVNALVYDVKRRLRGLEQVSEDVNRTLGADEQTTQSDGEGEGNGAALPTVEDALFMAPAIFTQIMIFTGTLFFFILTRPEIYGWIAKRLVPDDRRLETAHRLRAAEQQVGRYFLTICIINAGYAVVVTAAMMAIGLPAPVLWGIAAGLMNFILYLGPAALVGAFLLAGLIAFDGFYSLVPALTYFMINLVEAQFVTPTLVGRAMQTNPLLIFLALVGFLWLWGPLGGIIAIPLLLWVQVLAADIRAVRKAPTPTNETEPKAA